MIAQYLVAHFKHLNNYTELTIGFLTELLPALLLFLCSLSIIIASFKFYNLLNMAKDPLNLLLNLPLLKILLSFKPSFLVTCPAPRRHTAKKTERVLANLSVSCGTQYMYSYISLQLCGR